MHPRITPLAATGLLTAVLLAACSSDDPAESGPTPDSTSDSTTSATTEEASAAPSAAVTAEPTGMVATTE